MQVKVLWKDNSISDVFQRVRIHNINVPDDYDPADNNTVTKELRKLSSQPWIVMMLRKCKQHEQSMHAPGWIVMVDAGLFPVKPRQFIDDYAVDMMLKALEHARVKEGGELNPKPKKTNLSDLLIGEKFYLLGEEDVYVRVRMAGSNVCYYRREDDPDLIRVGAPLMQVVPLD